MEHQNATTKKTWITPELMMETVEGTEGKVYNPTETTATQIDFGLS